MRLNRTWLLGAAAIALAGCATPTIKTEAAVPVSVASVYQGVPDGATVIVKRNQSFSGALCSDGIFADGKLVAAIRTGQKVVFQLPPGHHIVGAQKQGICPGQMRELSVELAAGTTRTFVVDVSVNGEFIFQETAL